MRSIGRQLPLWQSKIPVYTEGRLRNYVERGYRGNELVYAGINLVARTFASGRLVVKDTSKDPRGVILPDHRLRQLIAKPWEDAGEFTLWEWTAVDLLVTGNCIWEKIRSATGKVVQLWPLEVDRVAVVPGESGMIETYLYEVGGIWYPIPARDILHWKLYNPRLDPNDLYFGLSPLSPAWRAIQTDNEQTDFTKVVLQNYAIPGVVLEAEQTITEPDAKEFKRRFKKAFGGRNRGEVFVAGMGLKVKAVGMDMEQLAFTELRGISETRVLMGLGGAPLLYLLGTATGISRSIYNNFHEAREALGDDVVGPLWNRIDDLVNAKLLPEFDTRPGVVASFDTSEVTAFRGRRERDEKSAAELLLAGAITRDEARSRIGLAPIEGSDVLYIPAQVIPVEVRDGRIVEDEPEEPVDPEDDEDLAKTKPDPKAKTPKKTEKKT